MQNISEIRILLPVSPMPQPRPRFRVAARHIQSYRTKSDMQYREKLQMLLKRAHKDVPIDGPCSVSVCFYLASPKKPRWKMPAVKPDIDNYIKALFDAMNGIIFTDDARVVKLHAEKCYGEPHIYLHIKGLLE